MIKTCHEINKWIGTNLFIALEYINNNIFKLYIRRSDSHYTTLGSKAEIELLLKEKAIKLNTSNLIGWN